MNQVDITVEVNGQQVDGNVPVHLTLARWLRDHRQAYEVKEGCNEGVCGTCTVLVDGDAVTACTTLAVQADGRSVETSRALADGDELDELQQAFWETGASQCGFCTQGMLMSATELLRDERVCSRAEIRDHLHGNLCRCTGYQSIIDAVELAQSRRNERKEGLR